MFLSIIIPSHNSSATIAEAILSVIRQTSPNWELIIINDGSADNTLQLIEEFAYNDLRIRIINLTENRGVATARNAGLDSARYDYIGFLDSDDTLEENFVERMLATAEAFNADVVWCQYKIINPEHPNGMLVENNLPKDKLLDNHMVLKSFFENTPGVAALWNKIYSRKYIDKAPTTRFNPQRRRAEDWEFNFSLFQKTGRVVAIQEPLYDYHIRGRASAMGLFKDCDFPLMFRSINLLIDCNTKNNMGYSQEEIYKNTAFSIFEHLFHSAKLNKYASYRKKLQNEEFRKILPLTDIRKLPLSYRLHALLIKLNLPLLAYRSARLYGRNFS